MLVLVLWWLQGVLIEPALRGRGHDLNWYDTDWLAALLALVAVGILGLLQRRIDRGTSLVLHMALGWWLGFGLLVLGLGLRMTPPRGDNWAGCLGMTIGAIVYCVRTGLAEVARAGVVSGFIGGIGFAAASMLKLVEVTSGYDTNWHSILEQTTGLFNGIGIAVAMAGLAARVAPIDHGRGSRRSGGSLGQAAGRRFRPPGHPLHQPEEERGRLDTGPRDSARRCTAFPPGSGSSWRSLVVAVGLAVLIARHVRRPLAVVPASPLGQGQGLFLVLLAIMVIGNFERALVSFAAQRLVTEGVIHCTAILCAVMLLTSDSPRPPVERPERPAGARSAGWGRLVAIGVTAALIMILADWAIVRAIYGDRFAGHSGKHIRFGPNATTQLSR